MIRPNKITIELDIEPRYSETFETLKELTLEIEGIKQQLLDEIDDAIVPIINGKVHSVDLNVVDKRIVFVYP